MEPQGVERKLTANQAASVACGSRPISDKIKKAPRKAGLGVCGRSFVLVRARAKPSHGSSNTDPIPAHVLASCLICGSAQPSRKGRLFLDLFRSSVKVVAEEGLEPPTHGL